MAGNSQYCDISGIWIPAFAGMTNILYTAKGEHRCR
jgi:hypothetical protein